MTSLLSRAEVGPPQGLEGKEKETLQLKNKFQWLSDNVKIFSSEIDVALEKAGATIAAGLKSAQARLEDIQTNLAQSASAFPLSRLWLRSVLQGEQGDRVTRQVA